MRRQPGYRIAVWLLPSAIEFTRVFRTNVIASPPNLVGGSALPLHLAVCAAGRSPGESSHEGESGELRAIAGHDIPCKPSPRVAGQTKASGRCSSIQTKRFVLIRCGRPESVVKMMTAAVRYVDASRHKRA